jgi:hypothetical protein
MRWLMAAALVGLACTFAPRPSILRADRRSSSDPGAASPPGRCRCRR